LGSKASNLLVTKREKRGTRDLLESEEKNFKAKGGKRDAIWVGHSPKGKERNGRKGQSVLNQKNRFSEDGKLKNFLKKSGYAAVLNDRRPLKATTQDRGETAYFAVGGEKSKKERYGDRIWSLS